MQQYAAISLLLLLTILLSTEMFPTFLDELNLSPEKWQIKLMIFYAMSNRLDIFLVEKAYVKSRSKAKELVFKRQCFGHWKDSKKAVCIGG